MRLSEEHLLLKNAVRRRMEEKDIREMIRKYEKHNAPFCWEFVRAMSELGLCGINIPEEYGGAGADNVSGVIAMIEMSRIWSGGALPIAVGNSLVGYPIRKFGTEAQERKWLPDLACGKTLGSFCLSEPNRGSDAARIETYAKAVDGGWLVNGEKHFITNAPIAKFFVLFARTNRFFADHRGVSAFLIALKNKDIKRKKSGKEKPISIRIDQKEGLHAAHMSAISFVDHFIPKESLLGEEEKGFRCAMETLNHGRVWISAQCIGLLHRAYELALEYAKNRKTFDQALIEHSGIGDPLVALAAASDIATILTFYAAHLEDEGKEFAHYASLAKLFASEELKILKGKAQEIFGGMGYVLDAEISRIVMDGDVETIYEGASNVQRGLIAKAWVDEKIPLYVPAFYRKEFYETKEKVRKELGGKSALLLKNQRLPFRMADILPWWVASDLIRDEFQEWPKEFIFFKNPTLLQALISERIKNDWDGLALRNDNLWDEAKEHLIKNHA